MDLVLVPVIIAIVEFLRRVKVSDYFAAITIAVSGGVGLLFGLLGAPGVADGWAGLVGGLAASGVITALSRVNTNSSVSEKLVK